MRFKRDTEIPRSTLQKSVLVFLIYTALFSVPYLVPVSQTISRSYVAGYSNRAAVAILILGMALFALFTRGEMSRPGEEESRLSSRLLLAGISLAILTCLIRLHVVPDGSPGGETYYFLNRQQMLGAGLAPYRQFEFPYGPMLLYPESWIQKAFHVSALHGYAAAWFISWVIGVSMIWEVVRCIDFPVPSRNLLFAFLVLAELVWTDLGGLNYTPFRSYAAAFCVVVTHTVWRRSSSAWMMSVGSVVATVIALTCSVEQAVGVAFGLSGYMLLLALSSKWKFPWLALSFSVAGMIGCFAVASRLGMLISLQSFSSGGYSYPLLPSPSICVALFAYVAAGCVFYRSLRLRRLESVAVPLTLAGCALLPVALGRCDILHITAAIPAFVVGTAGLYAMPSFKNRWLGIALLGLVLIPFTVRRGEHFWEHVPFASFYAAALAASHHPGAGMQDTNQFYVSPGAVTAASLPCDRTYFSPSFMPLATEPMRPACLDTGYYQGLVQITTPSLIQKKISELRSRPADPLLMENAPLEAQFPLELFTMRSLHKESGSFWVPRTRNVPLSYAPISNYIRNHYVAGPLLADGRLRIWYPSASLGE